MDKQLWAGFYEQAYHDLTEAGLDHEDAVEAAGDVAWQAVADYEALRMDLEVDRAKEGA